MSDADGAWPADPHDPRCPACDGPVSATATYCMHCGTDLPTGDSGTATAGANPTGATATSTAAATPTQTTDATATSPTDGRTSTGEAEHRGLLHPDGLLDDSLTLLVGVVAGVIAAILAAAAVVFALPGGWPFLVGGVAWVAVTAAVARSRSVVGAVMTGGYLVAMVLVALPVLLASTAPMAESGVGNRVGFAVVLALFAWPVAAALVVAGRWLDGRTPGGDG